MPNRLPVGDWVVLLARLEEARRRRPECWPELLDARIEGLFRAVLRFARTDGRAVFASMSGSAGNGPDVASLFRGWADRLADPGLGTVVDWWFPRRSKDRAYASPPLPAWSSPDRPLAILRANWSGQGDFLAVDHRARGEGTLLELCGLGNTWLGPTWVSDRAEGPGSGDAGRTGRRARPSFWATNPSADLAEWTFRIGPLRVTRTALLLRGRRIALLADQVEGRADRVGMRLALPDTVVATPVEGSRGWCLAARRGRPSARLVPLGLPFLPGPADRGTFTLEDGQLHLSQPHPGRRTWLPVLASWDPLRNRQKLRWRVLTVAEKSRPCPVGTAFAARVSWGQGETLLIYRSLAPPALRSVLGHQTRARFLVALFNQDGNVVPIVKVD